MEVVADDEGVLEIVCVEPDLAKDGQMDNGVGKCGEGGFSIWGKGGRFGAREVRLHSWRPSCSRDRWIFQGRVLVDE